MTDWEDSTKSELLVGADMPKGGIQCTLVALETVQMDYRGDDPRKKGTQEDVFKALFAEPDAKPWIPNKTGRKFLKNECGITNANISAFPPVPLYLFQTAASGGFPPGVGVAHGTATQTAGVPGPSTEAGAADGPPVSDDVPF